MLFAGGHWGQPIGKRLLRPARLRGRHAKFVPKRNSEVSGSRGWTVARGPGHRPR